MRILYALLFFSLVTAGCSGIVGNGYPVEETREISGFDKIHLSGSIDVEIAPGNRFEVKVSDDENLLPYLVTEVAGGTLSIHYKNNVNIMNGNGKVFVTMPVVSKIKTSGSGNVSSTGTLQSSSLITLESSGSGDMDLSLNAPDINVSGSGSGDFDLEGKTRNLECRISGSGDINASGLRSEWVKIRSSGSSNAKVFASVRLETHISGSGDLEYYGSPKDKDIHSSGSGSVKRGD